MRRGVLLDIDGTLTRSGGSGGKAIVNAYVRHFGVAREAAQAAVDAVDFRGNTDQLIFEQSLEQLGLMSELGDDLIAVYLDELDATLDSAEITILPGVEAMVERLLVEPSIQVGILTGNIRAGARKKLERVGMEDLVDLPGGFGDDGRRRTELAATARARMSDSGVSADALAVIGDSTSDVTAAKSIDALAIAVCTGWTGEGPLRAAGADLVLPDLSDPSRLWQLLDLVQ